MPDDANLQRALQSIAKGISGHHRVKLWIGDLGVPNSGTVLEIYKLPKEIGSFDFAPKMVVVVKPPNTLSDENIPLLRGIFNLTHAEAQIAIQIANGTERSAIALARCSSTGTVHAHLKSIFRKMDIGRETELASKVHSFLKSYSV